MDEEKTDAEKAAPASLEHTDTKESMRQLWWSIGAILIMLTLMAFFYF